MNNAPLTWWLLAAACRPDLCQILPQTTGRRPCLFLCVSDRPAPSLICMTARRSFIREGTNCGCVHRSNNEASRPMDQTDHQLYQSHNTGGIALTSCIASCVHLLCSPISHCMTTDDRPTDDVEVYCWAMTACFSEL
jgi:hypothetical protein